ncbi:phosphate transport system permease protein [Hamadaea flava]|uniref:Phosphate transport system permease protein PstA n=1 Tax=Hamadaea flava TaxID=1742688 RepID=A0ABV8LLN0_9ACTN|nr:phosphate ABC transporter permease PstA [Hamadaea flava]MCP2324106.1 phosphate transport system permease protein [Hamadaea flava]
MTTLSAPVTGLRARRLPKWAPWAVAAGSVLLSYLIVYAGGLLGGGIVLTAIASVVLYLFLLWLAARQIEGSRAARNRIASSLIYSAFILALLPLLSVAWTLVSKGIERMDGDFFSHSMNGITAFDANGGAYHAIIGTLEQAGIATLITVPLGVGAAIYIVEYGRGRLANIIRFFVDVMTGIPSIVAGLFILAFWVYVVYPLYSPDGKPGYSGFAASLALSVLMLPTITRSTEEMLRLVPDALREGSYALGIPKWKTIMRVVLPTALPGIVTGVMLAVARACGETAPVLLVAGGFNSINTNPVIGQQSSLAIYIWDQAGSASKYAPARAWAAALTLVLLVLILTIAAKLLARRSKLER